MLSDPAYANFRMLMGEPTLPPPMQPGMLQQGAPGPQAGGGANPGQVVSPGNAMSASDIQAKAGEIKPAQMPVNPLTNQRAPGAAPA